MIPAPLRRSTPPVSLQLEPDAVLALQRTAGNAALAAMLMRRNQEPDALHLAKRRTTGGQTGDDRITGRHLSNWAIASAGARLRAPSTLRRLQEDPGAASAILADIYLLLTERLWGRAIDPDTERPEPDEFEGSDHARGAAVYELGERWQPIEAWLAGHLVTIYVDELAQAAARTPPGATLVTDPAEYARIRTRPYNHITEDDRWGGMIRIGWTRDKMVIVDIHKEDLGGDPRFQRRAVNPGRIWFSIKGHPHWYYVRSSNLRDAEAFIKTVGREVSENTRFAAEIMPLLTKAFSLGVGVAGAFGPTLAYRIAIDIASVAIDEFGEEGLREARGQGGRSGLELLQSAGLGLLINRVMDGAFRLGSHTPAAGPLATFEQTAALRVRHNVVAAERGEVASAISAGQERAVKDPALRARGFKTEVEIHADGQRHTYRQKPDELYCRWSDTPMCDLDLGDQVRKAKAEANAPRPGETPEEWAQRTSPDWAEQTDVVRRMTLRDAEHNMKRAAMHAAVWNPNTKYQHYLTLGGYEDIMRGSSLRAGGGNDNWGGGDAVRARPLEEGSTPRPDSMYIDFVPAAGTPRPVVKEYMAGPYVAWNMPAGDLLSVNILRVRYGNGAVAIRIPGAASMWQLHHGGLQRNMTLDELLARGPQPTLP